MSRTYTALAALLWCAVLTGCLTQTLPGADPPAHSVAQRTALPPDEPPFLEDEIKGLPPGVELLPDGTMVQNGIVVSHGAIDSPERRKMRRMHEFSGQWIPAFLYLDDYRIFVPYKLRDVAAFEAGRERLTGLATASGSDVLVYAVTGANCSKLVLRYLDEYRIPEEHVIADADQIGPDLWLGALHISPNKRWIIVSVSPGRAQYIASDSVQWSDPGDWWLIDVTRECAPRRVLAAARLLSASWSANGSRAALEIESKAAESEPDHRMVLLDAETGLLSELKALPGQSCWSPSGDALFIEPRKDGGRVVVRYDFATGIAEPYVSAPAPAFWAPDFSRYALLDESRLRVGDTFGHSRTAPENVSATHLLGWSNRGELLAYRLPNDTLGFCVGACSTAAYDRLIAACPPAFTQSDPERPGLQKSMADGMAFDTRLSPVTLGSDPLGFRAWAETADGPCFLWRESAEAGDTLHILRFVTLTMEDLGLDPRGNLQEQMVAEAVEDAAGTLAHALRRYALDHDGRLPTQVGGLALEGALKPYLYDPHALRGLFAPEEVAARVLRPGANLRDLVASGGPAASVKVARLSEGTLAYEIIAVPGMPSALGELLDESHMLAVELRAIREGEQAAE